MLSRLVITFLPRSKHLLISWLQSPSAVILEPKRIKSVTVSTVSPSISHEVMRPDVMLLKVFKNPIYPGVLQCSCLENPRDGGASWAAVSGVAQSRT